MGKLTTQQKTLGFEIRGRLGRPGSLGRVHCGFNLLGAEDTLAGTYQQATFADGRAFSLRPFYWPSNPKTVAQVARRDLFKAGVSAYRALTPTELTAINNEGKRRGMSGYNLFLSKYLRAG